MALSDIDKGRIVVGRFYGISCSALSQRLSLPETVIIEYTQTDDFRLRLQDLEVKASRSTL